MRRRRRKRDVLAVSLFPFLAVLICTLGVLIVLLVLAVKSADDQATTTQQAADEVLQTELDRLSVTVDARKAQIDGLELVRPDAVDRLANSRETRYHLESELKRLEREQTDLAKSLLSLEQQATDMDRTATPIADDDAFATLEQNIEAAQEKLALKREQARDVGPETWAIVPHPGIGGTFRRPIFVECRANEIILQPHGIVLQQSDFLPPLFPGNMLDAALLTVRNYWNKYNLDGDDGKAYPLLVVRPDGAETYTAARYAMKSWDDEFGYELVETDKQLDFGSADPQLAAEIQAAVDVARPRQLQLAALQRQKERQQRLGSNVRKSERRPGLTVSGSQGGFVSNGYQSESGDDFNRDAYDQHRFGDRGASRGANLQDAGQNSSTQDFSPSASDRQSFVSTDNGSFAGAQQANSGTAKGASASDNGSFAPTSGDQSGSNGSANSMAQSAHSQTAESQTAEMQTAEMQHGAQSQAAGQPSSAAAAEAAANATSMAQTRGAGWALPSKTPGATAYVRPVRVICHAEYLIVRNGTRERRIPFAADTSAAVDPLVDEIWRQIEAWGTAGSRGYWKPELRISVLPGANDRFRTLQGLLHKSGLVLEEAN